MDFSVQWIKAQCLLSQIISNYLFDNSETTFMHIGCGHAKRLQDSCNYLNQQLRYFKEEKKYKIEYASILCISYTNK